MKKTLLILAAALSGVLAAGAQTGREWQDPAVNEINRLPMRSSFAAGERLSLDGVWKFHWVRNASERPSGIGAVDYDDAAWGSMPVPGMWELNGYGDPVYVNIGYAWRGNFRNDPPYVPDAENHVVPTGARSTSRHRGAARTSSFRSVPPRRTSMSGSTDVSSVTARTASWPRSLTSRSS